MNCKRFAEMFRIFQTSRPSSRHAPSFLRDTRGQGLLEWTVALPAFLVLAVGIAFYAWTWWNQTTAATAIHDGTYVAAIKGGDLGAGYGRIRQMLNVSVGRFSDSYSVRLARTGGTRSIAGDISNPRTVRLPFLGRMAFGIRASSFQRAEQFYGGPPRGWW